MNVEEQARIFRDSPIGSRITNHLRTVVRNAVMDSGTRSRLIVHINATMRGERCDATILRQVQRVTDRATGGIIELVLAYCEEINPR